MKSTRTQKLQAISEGPAGHLKPVYGYKDMICALLDANLNWPSIIRTPLNGTVTKTNLFIARVLMDFKVFLHTTEII